MTERYTFSPDGMWSLQQLMPAEPAAGYNEPHWQTCMIGFGFVYLEEAQQEANRLSEIQPGRWRVISRGAGRR